MEKLRYSIEQNQTDNAQDESESEQEFDIYLAVVDVLEYSVREIIQVKYWQIKKQSFGHL